MKIELPEALTGDGVVLRRLRADDAGAYVAAFRADADLGRLLGMEEDPGEAAIRDRAERMAEHAAEGRVVELAVSDPGDDSFLGSMILHSFDWNHRRCEVGFWLVPAAHGAGSAAGAALGGQLVTAVDSHAAIPAACTATAAAWVVATVRGGTSPRLLPRPERQRAASPALSWSIGAIASGSAPRSTAA